MNKDSKIVVLAGGVSQEREVSLRSGQNVYDALLRLGYKNSGLFNFSTIEEISNLEDIDLAVLMTHGKFGEDGGLQSMLDAKGIKYTGSSASVSKICMDKVTTKELLKANNLPVLESYSAIEIASKKTELEGPLILKEIDGGSSIGVTKYDRQADLIAACHPEELKATSGSQQQPASDLSNFFVERFISGTEITASIIKIEGELKALPLLELRSKNEFYDYQAKYTEGMTEFILPAQISEEQTKQIQELALKAYQALGCSGPARIDFILDAANPYILEVNTLPGMTNTSDLPAQAQAVGIKYDQLVELIIN
ncbi:MAG: D-alanine--D-alanine ligase [Candidatus Melainabacteria bacterium]|nr:D-alanine--D-alanine ligase [Candidatus Melainabacteria bacterium]